MASRAVALLGHSAAALLFGARISRNRSQRQKPLEMTWTVWNALITGLPETWSGRAVLDSASITLS
jgi:hypothetical protein